MSVVINSTDITACVQESTYKVDSMPTYAVTVTNADGRKVKRGRIDKVVGSFDLVFIPDLTMSYSDFLTALAGATTGDVLTITLDVNNLNQSKTIEVYYQIEFKPPRKISNTVTYKRCTMTIEER